MLEVNGFLIQDDIQDILIELRTQLHLNGVERFKDIKKSGNNLLCNCPFHNSGAERKPSFGILLTDKRGKKAGTGHCFTCGWAGSLEEMISNCFGKDDFGVYGSKWLVQNFLSVAIENRPEIDLGLDRKSVQESVKYVSEEELDSYRQYHSYMWARKLTPEIVDLFDIGYDAKTECVTFPQHDEKGNVLFIARRSVKTKYFNYPESASKPLYGLYQLKSLDKMPDKLYICESMLDALSFWRVGKPAVALNGLGNDLQFKQLRALPIRTFIVATDCDDAGLKARERIASQLKSKITMQVYFPDGCKDANDCSDEELTNLSEVFI